MNRPNHPTIHVGTVLDNAYRLVRSMGEGGMSSLYEATHLRLNRRVVVKLLSSELSQDPESLARFRREADVTSALGHPHIIQVSDFGTAPSGEPYLVLEFLEGEDLDQRLRRVNRLALPQAFRVVKQVASALLAAHDKGIVHRDLKPANIFLISVAGERDFVKVLDFGISKVQSAVTKLTHGHTVLGTPYYMSPEQATGHSNEVDHRTDQWALSCITWQILCGKCPFQGDDSNQLLYQVVFGAPPPLLPKVPGLPSDVEYVLRRALSKHPGDRFGSIQAFAHALKNAALTNYPDERTPTPRPYSLSSFEMASDGSPLRDGPVEGSVAAALPLPQAEAEVPPVPAPVPERGAGSFAKRIGVVALAFAIVGVGGGVLLSNVLSKPEPPLSVEATEPVVPPTTIVPLPASAPSGPPGTLPGDSPADTGAPHPTLAKHPRPPHPAAKHTGETKKHPSARAR